jgi:hypothetical protein
MKVDYKKFPWRDFCGLSRSTGGRLDSDTIVDLFVIEVKKKMR